MHADAVPQIVVEALGWLGCVLLIVSILQRRILALRVLSLVSSLILTAYNLVHGVWPMVMMNAAIVVINAIYLTRASRVRRPRRDHPRSHPPARPGLRTPLG